VTGGGSISGTTGATGTASANCSSGVVLGGGGSASGAGILLQSSQPNSTSNPTGWTVTYYNASGASGSINAYVICSTP
jgi:hypothetical protein